ncbi:MAG: peptidylprolyl isomerase [Alphaproteobacteria bacterium]|nr:peptidylprolyl isomerase [Alphaproteobacteria bacterium]
MSLLTPRLFALSAALALTIIAPAWAQNRADSPLLATVNGEEIRASDVDQFVAGLPPQVQQVPREELQRLVINELVNTRVIGAAARGDGIEKDDDFKRRLKFATDRLIGEVYLAKRVKERITDARVKQRYDELVKNQPAAAEVRASHIILASKDEAEKIATEIKRGGNFDELARTRSNTKAGIPGGDLGYFQKGQMLPAIADAAFALETGQVSGPIQTQFGWHVVKVVDRRRQPPPSIEEMREEISQELQGEIVQEIAQEARKKVKIVMFGADGKPLPATP